MNEFDGEEGEELGSNANNIFLYVGKQNIVKQFRIWVWCNANDYARMNTKSIYATSLNYIKKYIDIRAPPNTDAWHSSGMHTICFGNSLSLSFFSLLFHTCNAFYEITHTDANLRTVKRERMHLLMPYDSAIRDSRRIEQRVTIFEINQVECGISMAMRSAHPIHHSLYRIHSRR